MIISGDRRADYAGLEKLVAKAASGFSSLGAREGDAIALMLRNDIAFFEAAAATNLIGANVVPINWHLKTAEANYILRDFDARALVCHEDLFPQIASDVPAELPTFLVETPPEVLRAYKLQQGPWLAAHGAVPWSSWVEAQPPLAGPFERGARSSTPRAPPGCPRG